MEDGLLMKGLVPLPLAYYFWLHDFQFVNTLFYTVGGQFGFFSRGSWTKAFPLN